MGSAFYKLASFIAFGASILDYIRPRHKMHTIKEILKEKKEWCRQFDDHPYEFWKRRWDYLCRRLSTYSDMARSLQQQRYIPKKEEK